MPEVDPRTRLREEALKLFGRQGVQATSTRAILDAAGMRNPSAISYHFGSKAALVDDLVTELITDAWPVVALQADLAAGGTPTVREWASVAAESAAQLISTERGCLLARLWWEYDCLLFPDAFEEFLASGLPLAIAWQAGIHRTFSDLPPLIAVARNVIVVRTIEWLIARRARNLLIGRPERALHVKDPAAVSAALLEVSMALLTAPVGLTDEDMTFGA
jgi:TetR/AcrR family transcriptional regulator, regulator of cefoperazone and chloramphenicol sensitivity